MNKVYPLDVTTGYPRGASPLPTASAPAEAENVISLSRVVRAVRRRLGLMAAVFVLVFAAVAIHSSQLTPSYTATSRVIANSRSQNVVDIGAVLSGIPQNTAVLDTEAEILMSRSLIEKLVKRLDLVNNPEFNYMLAPPSEMDKRIDGVKSFISGLVPFGKKDTKAVPPPAPGSPEAIAEERALLDSVIDTVISRIKVGRLSTT
ncbi:MAG: hypothetical protein EOP61_37425, partial [Sphingomonadales bacterium]